jgi:DNA repair protein RadC
MALTANHNVKAVVVLSVGGLAGTALLPRDAFTPMIRHAASGFAVAHNHPSGDRLPSREDIAFTNALSTMGALLGIPLVDHLVVARDGFTSFADSGLLLDENELPTTKTLRDMAGPS